MLFVPALEALHVELIDRAVHELLREERLPAEAVVERQARPDSPGVLRVQPEVLAASMSRVFGAAWTSPFVPSLPNRKSASPSPVIVPSMLNWPGERTFAERSVTPARVAPAEHELVTAAHERQVIADLPGGRDDVRRTLSVPPPSWNPPVTFNSM